MSDRGEWNIGQLMRDRHGSDAVRIGFSTHHGWVTAASDGASRRSVSRCVWPTSSVQPLDRSAQWEADEGPETFTSGI